MRNVTEYIRLTRAAHGVKNARPSKARRWQRRFSVILDRITLETYIGWLNNETPDDGFQLVADLDHWAEYGITTPRQLGRYLDACCEKESAEYLADQCQGYGDGDAYAAEWDATNNL